jgi:hypothetical protein
VSGDPAKRTAWLADFDRVQTNAMDEAILTASTFDHLDAIEAALAMARWITDSQISRQGLALLAGSLAVQEARRWGGVPPAPRYPAGTPEYAAYAAELYEELDKWSRGEPPYEYPKGENR